MRFLKLYEDFKEGKFTQDDIIRCVKEKKPIFASVIKDFPGNDPETPLEVVSIDDNGLITILIDGNIYYVELKNVEKLGL